jgi:hypothetical protein
MTPKRPKPPVARWALTAVVSGLAGSATAAWPPAPAEGTLHPPERSALDARVQAVRAALAVRALPEAAAAVSLIQADPTAQAPPWANWSNWSNWPKWSKWSNWANT